MTDSMKSCEDSRIDLAAILADAAHADQYDIARIRKHCRALVAEVQRLRRLSLGTDEMDVLLERWDQTAPWMQKQIVTVFAARMCQAEDDVERLRVALTRIAGSLPISLEQTIACEALEGKP